MSINALLTLGSLAPSAARDEALAGCLAPNSSRCLVPARSLIVPDAPWLDGRLDAARLNLVHPALTRATGSFALGSGGGVEKLKTDGGGGGSGAGEAKSIVELLGVRKLSAVVSEELRCGFGVTEAHNIARQGE